MSFAKGKESHGFCDKTGFRYPLKDLVRQYENGLPNGLRVGRDMLDIDQEQLKVGQIDASDPQALKDPRPDIGLVASSALPAWNPVGGGVTVMGSRTVGLEMAAVVGRVTVSTG